MSDDAAFLQNQILFAIAATLIWKPLGVVLLLLLLYNEWKDLKPEETIAPKKSAKEIVKEIVKEVDEEIRNKD